MVRRCSPPLENEPVDLVILDVMLHAEDGFTLCRQLRAASPVPIIMLTAVADHTDRVVGLELGADDYLTKPFDQRELLARVKAVLRRTAEKAAAPTRSETRPVLCFAGWRLSMSRVGNCARPKTRSCCSRAANSTYCSPLPNIHSAF